MTVTVEIEEIKESMTKSLEIRGIKASIVLTAYNGIIYFSARSIDEVNVQVMMEKSLRNLIWMMWMV